MDAYIKHVLFQRLPYLSVPCYTVHMCCGCTRLIASLLAEWIQKEPHSLCSFLSLSLFHVVNVCKGRFIAARLKAFLLLSERRNWEDMHVREKGIVGLAKFWTHLWKSAQDRAAKIYIYIRNIKAHSLSYVQIKVIWQQSNES